MALIRMMHEETVPDPGEAYWGTMPDRVFKAVMAQKARKRSVDLSWLIDRLTLPRWAIASATIGMVLLVAWFAIQPLPEGPQSPASTGYDLSYEIMTEDGAPAAALNHDELNTVTAWAGHELASIGREAEAVFINHTGTDMYEELAELNSREAEHLSTMLDQYEQEG
jgi:hypothetical protein